MFCQVCNETNQIQGWWLQGRNGISGRGASDDTDDDDTDDSGGIYFFEESVVLLFVYHNIYNNI